MVPFLSTKPMSGDISTVEAKVDIQLRLVAYPNTTAAGLAEKVIDGIGYLTATVTCSE